MKIPRVPDGISGNGMIEQKVSIPLRTSAGLLALGIGVFAVLAVSCSGGEDPSPTPEPTVALTAPPATATAVPTPQPTPTSAPAPEPTAEPAPEPTSPSDGGVTVSLSEASAARYLIGEQLARLSTPIVAIGETPDVSGAVVFDSDGKVDSSKSVVTVGLAGLTSDESRRDNYVRNRIFDVSTYPNAELVVTDVADMPWPLPESGEVSFLLIGDFTVRDTTVLTKWEVTAEISGGTVTGQAKTVVTFDQLEMSKPSLSFIISVEDEILLEMDIEAEISGG